MNPEDWQPIETAPKDGTRVLARCNDSRWPYVAFFGMGGWYSSPGDYSRKPTHWRPLSNLELERTSDADDRRKPDSDNATLGTSNPSESVATVGGTPRTDEAQAVLKRWEARSREAGMRGSHLESDDPKPPDGWEISRSLETELLTARAENTILRAAMGIQPNETVPPQSPTHGSVLVDLAATRRRVSPTDAPASPAWLAKAAQREDALTIAELRKEVERLTKERDEAMRLLSDLHYAAGDGAHIHSGLQAEFDCTKSEILTQRSECFSLRQQLAEAKQANARAHERVHHLEESENCVFCETYPATGNAQQVPMCGLCQLESNADVLRSQLSAATARAEQWEKVAKELMRHGKPSADRLEWIIQFITEKPFKPWHTWDEWLPLAQQNLEQHRTAISAFDALTQREQQA